MPTLLHPSLRHAKSRLHMLDKCACCVAYHVNIVRMSFEKLDTYQGSFCLCLCILSALSLAAVKLCVRVL